LTDNSAFTPLSHETLTAIQATLYACDPRARGVFSILLDGWRAAGGAVQCNQPGRIYLRMAARPRPGRDEPRQFFNMAVLATPEGGRGPAIDIAWNLAAPKGGSLAYAPDAVAVFEGAVRELPGYAQEGVVHRLHVGKAFQQDHAQKLLEAMVTLKNAAGQAPGTISKDP
jgi:hypothetical protein